MFKLLASNMMQAVGVSFTNSSKCHEYKLGHTNVDIYRCPILTLKAQQLHCDASGTSVLAVVTSISKKEHG